MLPGPRAHRGRHGAQRGCEPRRRQPSDRGGRAGRLGRQARRRGRLAQACRAQQRARHRCAYR
eukprot:353078-Lingulodinium_polyedra.AAC.1